MLTALWGWLTKTFRLIGIFTVIAVALSRIALGMHFMADVLFAIIASVFIAITVKHVMTIFFAKRKKATN
jgi:membrane-associated phospholipid phosphatase